VSRILTRNGRATGVVLENGDEILASVVSSSLDPRVTFTRFLDPRELPTDFVDEVRRYKFRGSSGKVNLALDGLPNFTSLPGEGGIFAVRFRFPRASITWSVPMTRRSTAGTPNGRT
jgi:phytoene dehydrogenase-like protein